MTWVGHSRRGFLAAALALPLACSLTHHGQKGGKGEAGPQPVNGDPAEHTKLTDGDVVEYARYCKQELGIPEAVQAPFNCMDGAEIPITIDGEPPTEANYANLATGKIGCDRPSWLGEGPCSNYAFVQQRQLADGVEAVLLCRMRSFSTPKDRAARLADYQAKPTFDNFMGYYVFDSLGLIWANTKTGKTCFFDFVGKTYGGYVPSPDDEKAPTFAQLPDPKPPTELAPGSGKEKLWQRSARLTWKSPHEVAEKDNCIRCHDTGAFKSSPWVKQVYAVPHNDQNLPYQVIGKSFAAWQQHFPARAISTLPVKGSSGADEPQVCTSCHRIGAQATCALHLYFATGDSAPVKLSDQGESFALKNWMPPSPDAWKALADEGAKDAWHKAYDRHVSRLKCCCANPQAVGCTSQDLTQSPLAAPVAGTGPGICP